MSVTMESLEELEGMDLDGVPPCGSYPREFGFRVQCDRPSVLRLLFCCPRCPRSVRMFLCAECVARWHANGIKCRHCMGEMSEVKESKGK